MNFFYLVLVSVPAIEALGTFKTVVQCMSKYIQMSKHLYTALIKGVCVCKRERGREREGFFWADESIFSSK